MHARRTRELPIQDSSKYHVQKENFAKAARNETAQSNQETITSSETEISKTVEIEKDTKNNNFRLQCRLCSDKKKKQLRIFFSLPSTSEATSTFKEVTFIRGTRPLFLKKRNCVSDIRVSTTFGGTLFELVSFVTSPQQHILGFHIVHLY